MKVKITAFILVLILTRIVSTRGADPNVSILDSHDPYLALKSAAHFSLGPSGIAGTPSPGEVALREVLKMKEPEKALQMLLKEANPAGQMYALMGLRVAAPASFDRYARPYLKMKTNTVTRLSGCLAFPSPVSEIARGIISGKYSLENAALQISPVVSETR